MAARGSRTELARARAEQDDPQPLSEDVIVAATLKLIRRSGTAKFTMRELAAELGVSSMAAYYHVENKTALFALIAEHVYGQVAIPGDDLPWDERLRGLVLERRRVVRQYPGLPEVLSGVDAPAVRRIEDAVLDLLLEAGFEPARAVPASRVLMDWTLGNAAVDSMLRNPKVRRPKSRWTKAQTMTREDPELRRLHSDDYFEFGLDVVLAGLRESLAPDS
jgi:AcrR family transcriptional regulator